MNLLHALRRSLCRGGALAIALSMLVAAAPAADPSAGAGHAPFVGTFSNGKLTVELSPSGEGYAGKVSQGANHYPARATANDQGLAGSFSASGNAFAFTAKMAGDQMILVSGGVTYTLPRAAENPLAAPPADAGPANPLGDSGPAASQPAADSGGKADTLGAFTVLGSTPAGKALFLKLPAAATLEAVITQTADEVGKICDGKPAVSGAFADAKSKGKGGASFTARQKSKEMRGLIFCGTSGGAGSATVLLEQADAPKENLAALMGFMPAPMAMQTHKFPDNSGSVDLPAGWTAVGSSATYGVFVHGPAGQAVVCGNTQPVWTPDCRMVRTSEQTYRIQMQNYASQQRNYQQQVAMHQRFPNTLTPVPPQKPPAFEPDPNVRYPKMNFCRECSGADEVLKYWYPIAEDKGKRAGGPYTTLDQVIEVIPAEANPYIPGSKSGVAYIAVTDLDGNKTTHYRALNRISTAPVAPGECWQMTFSVMRAPDASFDRDLPVMNAIMNSVTLNMDVVNARIAADGAAARKLGADNERQLLKQGREFRQQQEDHFNRFEAQIAAREQAVHNSSSDYIEYVLGVRDVYDSRTGRMLSVDLFNSHAIVGDMNDLTNDPGRFVEIPLRYER